MKNEEFMLTTYDNPFNPFEDFEIWWKFDQRLGHDCCGTLARHALISPIFSDERNEEEILRAAKEICENEPTIYKMVYRSDYSVSA